MGDPLFAYLGVFFMLIIGSRRHIDWWSYCAALLATTFVLAYRVNTVRPLIQGAARLPFPAGGWHAAPWQAEACAVVIGAGILIWALRCLGRSFSITSSEAKIAQGTFEQRLNALHGLGGLCATCCLWFASDAASAHQLLYAAIAIEAVAFLMRMDSRLPWPRRALMAGVRFVWQ